MKLFKRLGIIIILLAISICFSAYKAKVAADEYIKQAKDEIVFDKMGFSPSIYFESLDPPEKYTNNWRVSYCPKDEFCCFPVEIYVSLAGNVELTNPRDLKERIKKMKQKL